MNSFWQKQTKLFKFTDKKVGYHPVLIRFCLSLASKSKSCYEELRNSNILRLPSTLTLKKLQKLYNISHRISRKSSTKIKVTSKFVARSAKICSSFI